MAELARRITRRALLMWMGGLAGSAVVGHAGAAPKSKPGSGTYSNTYSNTY